jgi:hypothetical protein
MVEEDDLDIPATSEEDTALQLRNVGKGIARTNCSAVCVGLVNRLKGQHGFKL